ncbi:Hypothetical protein BRZCDTV_144 [Brazilian cedratvirus IHUMI]|uniref:Uncharacterized protein n=1 Tax=Brazilian cedratvirus IHUMI TaxID=2126980 RepID=A0A2R8FDN9_9VIRU|nr:Hypothetical protein BRZCDTV_144 [Brazilian cedratvirus IHUMI]
MSCGPKPGVTLERARELAYELDIDLEVISLQEWRRAIEVELEHWETVRCSLLSAAMIARDHIEEFPNYYEELEKMEARLRRQ